MLQLYWVIFNKMQSAVRTLMEATVETASTPATRLARRRSVRQPSPPPRWRTALLLLQSKLNTRRTWVAVMFALGTVDVVLNIVNFIQMSSDDLNYGLVIGPPSRELWISMCVFTVFGTLLYIPETINTFSALYRYRPITIRAIRLYNCINSYFTN